MLQVPCKSFVQIGSRLRRQQLQDLNLNANNNLELVATHKQLSDVSCCTLPCSLFLLIGIAVCAFPQGTSRQLVNNTGCTGSVLVDHRMGVLTAERGFVVPFRNSHHRRRGPRPITASSTVSTEHAPSHATGASQPWAGLHAVVIGAGPAGSTAAMVSKSYSAAYSFFENKHNHQVSIALQLLARRGMAVDVYEKRERPTNQLAASLHSYPVRFVAGWL